jgi:hypothetical protein
MERALLQIEGESDDCIRTANLILGRQFGVRSFLFSILDQQRDFLLSASEEINKVYPSQP